MIIAGVDEVGRGCLAGPVVAAAVILKKSISSLNDSKKLSKKKRELLYKNIVENSLSVSIGIKWNDYIDKHNIKVASQHAMIDAIKALSIKPDKVLVDGFSLDIDIENEGIIKGDQKFEQIMGANSTTITPNHNSLGPHRLIYTQDTLGETETIPVHVYLCA